MIPSRGSLALTYRALGLSVIPVHAPGMPADGLEEHDVGKVPLVVWKPYQERLPSLDEIKGWWRRWPSANVGIVTGALSGVVAIDVDPIGMEALMPTWSAHLPPTWSTMTGRGGRHLFFRYPGPTRSKARILPGVDVRADGGYVVAAGSVHGNEQPYEWEVSPFDDVDLAELPSWLIYYLRSGHALNGSGNGHKGHEAFRLPPTIPEGVRNEMLFRFGRSQRASGIPFDLIAATVAAVNRHSCVPPLDDTELESLITGAWTRDDEQDFQPPSPSAQAMPPTATTAPTDPALKPLASLQAHPALDVVERALRQASEPMRKADPLRRTRLRTEAVAWLDALKVPSAARMVDAAMATAESTQDAHQGAALTFTEPAPWPEPVDGAQLLRDLVAVLERFCVLPPHAAHATALFIVYTHVFAAFDISPLLGIVSATLRCGKTTLLRLLMRFVAKPLPASNVSPAAIFRAIEQWSPTFVIDEADSFARRSDEIRNLLNAGHTHDTAHVIRTVGDEHEARKFSVWCPKILAQIGRLSPTLHDRAIVIKMQRRTDAEDVEKFRLRKARELQPLLRQIVRWAKDHQGTLGKLDEPAPPPGLDDRAADNWAPLFRIAALAGEEWPQLAHDAALALSNVEKREDDSLNTQLLRDIRDIFAKRHDGKLPVSGRVDRITNAELVAQLKAMDERPWATYAKRKDGITARHVARLLEGFDVKSTVFSGVDTKGTRRSQRGYDEAHFSDVFSRYLPPLIAPVLSTPDEALGDA